MCIRDSKDRRGRCSAQISPRRPAVFSRPLPPPGGAAAPRRAPAVSYTHLDVYKRQGILCVHSHKVVDVGQKDHGLDHIGHGQAGLGQNSLEVCQAQMCIRDSFWPGAGAAAPAPKDFPWFRWLVPSDPRGTGCLLYTSRCV